MSEIPVTPLYANWSFWAVLIAFVAVVLSQLPPVHFMLKRARLDVELHSRIFLTHMVGNPNLSAHLIIHNIGGRVIKVKGLTVRIKRDDLDVGNYPSQNYLQDPNDSNSVLFTQFLLRPSNEWTHIVNFLNYFDRENEKEFKQLQAKLKADILKQRESFIDKDQFAHAKQKLVDPLIRLFDKNFIWLPGQYTIELRVDTNIQRANITQKYRFTLFESDSEELTKYTEEYKIGAGIYFPSTTNRGISVHITENKVNK